MRIYQMGGMRGFANLNFNSFAQGQAYLEWLGHDVVSPHSIDLDEGYVVATKGRKYHGPTEQWIDTFHNVRLTPEFLMERAMKRDITELLKVDAISGLPGWRDSQGSRVEYMVANAIGLPCFEHTPFLSFCEAQPLELIEVSEPQTRLSGSIGTSTEVLA